MKIDGIKNEFRMGSLCITTNDVEWEHHDPDEFTLIGRVLFRPEGLCTAGRMRVVPKRLAYAFISAMRDLEGTCLKQVPENWGGKGTAPEIVIPCGDKVEVWTPRLSEYPLRSPGSTVLVYYTIELADGDGICTCSDDHAEL